jgi:toxin ParE1/3/4
MKEFTLAFHPLVIQDVEAIVLYYNQESEGLGQRFFDDFKTTYQLLRTNPFYQIRYQDVRCVHLRKFPYMIHFSVNEIEGLVFVQAVIGTSQNPDEHWIKRPLE